MIYLLWEQRSSIKSVLTEYYARYPESSRVFINNTKEFERCLFVKRN